VPAGFPPVPRYPRPASTFRDLRYYEGSDSCTGSPAGAGLPVSCVPPSYRSAPNHVVRPTLAFAATLAGSMSSRLRPTLAGSPLAHRRIRFVFLRTDSSPPVAPHPASQRRSYLWLRSLWPTPTRTCTVLMKRPHGRTRVRIAHPFRRTIMPVRSTTANRTPNKLSPKFTSAPYPPSEEVRSAHPSVPGMGQDL
jgi:hypothetical protein